MRARARILAAVLALAAAPVLAQQVPDGPIPQTPPAPVPIWPDAITIPETERRYIDAAEFRAEFENKTVHLSASGTHYGSEYYLPGDRTVWIGAGGPCQKGDWTFENASLFCFTYGPTGPFCWRVFESDGEYFAESVDGLTLLIYAVEEAPLGCDPELLS